MVPHLGQFDLGPSRGRLDDSLVHTGGGYQRLLNVEQTTGMQMSFKIHSPWADSDTRHHITSLSSKGKLFSPPLLPYGSLNAYTEPR